MAKLPQNLVLNLLLQPKERQLLEMMETGHSAMIGYGGARGGAKSHAARACAVVRRMRYKGSTALIFRKTYDDLYQNHILEIMREWPELYNNCWNAENKLLKMPGGGMILFRYADTLKDIMQMKGPGYDDVFIDEASDMEPDEIAILSALNRSTRTDITARTVLTFNPGGPSHCVPFGEVLTPTGWKDIKTMQVGEQVFTVDDDGVMTLTRVDQVHSSHYEGDMVYATARGLKMACTPNHKVAKRGGIRVCGHRNTKFMSLVPFEDLPGQATILRSVKWHGRKLGYFYTPHCPTRKRKLHQPLGLCAEKYLDLLGWFLSEGWTSPNVKQFGIAQDKPQGREKIEKLLNECGFKWTKNPHQFIVYAADWWLYFKQFGKCREKFIPQVVKDATPEQLRILFTSLMDGDGHWYSKTGGSYFTISKQLADDVSEVALKLGYIVCINTSQQKDRRGPRYTVNFKESKSGGTELLTGCHKYGVETKTKRRSQISREPFSGPVYCIGVPNTHSFLIRQNGSVWVSGNSHLKRIFVDKDWTDQERRLLPEFIQSHAWDNVFWVKKALMDDGLREDQLGQWYKWPQEKKIAFLLARSDYGRVLDGLPAHLRDPWLYGLWDSFVGQRFATFRKDIHVVKPFPIPKWWNKWGCNDPGYNDPGVWHWCADDQDGNVYVYREMVFSKKHNNQSTYEQQARMVAKASEGEDMAYWVTGGDALQDAGGARSGISNETIQDYYIKGGLGGIVIGDHSPGSPDRRANIMDEYLKVEPDGFGKPNARLKIFDCCKEIIETLPALPVDPAHPERVLSCTTEHAFESLGRGLVFRHAPSTPEKPKYPAGTYGSIDGSNEREEEEEVRKEVLYSMPTAQAKRVSLKRRKK